jgi:thioredoxin reductase (NADPH)
MKAQTSTGSYQGSMAGGSGSARYAMDMRRSIAESECWGLNPRQHARRLFLRTYSRQVLLFETDASEHFQIDDALAQAGIQRVGRPVRVERLDDGVSVTVAGGKRFDLDVLYPALGCHVRSELAAALEASRTGIGNVTVDAHQQTTVECLYAAGDIVSDLHQLAVATGHAAIAATAIHNRLHRNPR